MKFCNGHMYALTIQRVRGTNRPEINVEMASGRSAFRPVFGKMDTGAFRTTLDFKTAGSLGINDPTRGCIAKGTAHTVTGEAIPYFVHKVFVQVRGIASPPILFELEAAVAERVKGNLFGVDWLENLCLAFDSASVQFLRD